MEKLNLYDLKYIYENDINNDDRKSILISEKAVNYDLLGREGTVNQLYTSIISSQSDSSFVIGVEGEWGSGKSTIINLLKEKINLGSDSNIIPVYDFDFCLFGTQEALLMAMYDTILQKLGIKVNMYHSRKILRSVCNIISDKCEIDSLLTDIVFGGKDEYEQAKETKEALRRLLEGNSKIIVFFVDNFDRADADNIIFFFKIIGTIFALPKIVYVLLYDRDRLIEVLSDTQKINPKYMEKIIQQEVKIPSISKEQLQDLYNKCINNILRGYGIEADEIPKYKYIEEFLCSEVGDLRKFKRLINTVFTNVFCNENILCKNQLLALEIIRFLEPKLYKIIRDNRTYFVSHDRFLDVGLYIEAHNYKTFNDNGKNFLMIYLKNIVNMKICCRKCSHTLINIKIEAV